LADRRQPVEGASSLSLKDKIKARVERLRATLEPWADRNPINGGLYEFFIFGLKQAWASLFGAAMLALIVGTHFAWPLLWPHGAPLARYDFLVVSAIAIQAMMLATRLEQWDEALVILVFHVTGTAMELFKTAHGSWIYSEPSLLRIGGVPLFSGFMYASIGSYIVRIWRLMDLEYERFPPLWAPWLLAILSYINFFSHHFLPDIRIGLFVFSALIWRRTWVRFTPDRKQRRMPLLLSALLVALFIWIAENLGTFAAAWVYPSQARHWTPVGPGKIGAWYLLVTLSFVLVTIVRRPNTAPETETRPELVKAPVACATASRYMTAPMTLTLYDTMTRAKRAFVPVDPERVTMYVCGPTVYNYAHVGNARPVVAFDVLFRLLRRIYGESHVLYAANVTDVDDKINLKAQAEGVAIDVITSRYLDAYHADMSALGALKTTFEPRATQTMDAIIDMIGRLTRANAAYEAEGHVLFSTQAYADYGALSGRTLDDMIAGARVDVAPYKQHPADFVLWKPSKPGEPVWESPFGPGRPGWHIECSAMIEQTLGLPIDIHGGGNDLIFPHHENERAQGVCADGHAQDHKGVYANYWLHNGFLNMGSEKMSKSLGNVELVHSLITRWPPEALRWALLASHYRQPLAWSDEIIAAAKATLDALYGALLRASDVTASTDQPSPAFIAALEDDLNTPRANAELSALARRLEGGTAKERAEAKGQLLASAQLTGFLTAEPQAWFHGGADPALSARVDALIADRIAARGAKDWARADAIRAELTGLGVEVMDSATGATWKLKERA